MLGRWPQAIVYRFPEKDGAGVRYAVPEYEFSTADSRAIHKGCVFISCVFCTGYFPAIVNKILGGIDYAGFFMGVEDPNGGLQKLLIRIVIGFGYPNIFTPCRAYALLPLA